MTAIRRFGRWLTTIKERPDIYGFWRSLLMLLVISAGQQVVFFCYDFGVGLGAKWFGTIFALFVAWLFIKWVISYRSNRAAMTLKAPHLLVTAVGCDVLVYGLTFLWTLFGPQLLGLNTTTSATSENQQTIVSFLQGGWSTAFILVMTIVVAPFLEEFCYRYLLIKPQRQHHNRWRVLGAVVFFALAHVAEQLPQVAAGKLNISAWFYYFMQYAIMGFVFAELYNRKRNYKLNVVTHGLWNAFSMTMALLV